MTPIHLIRPMRPGDDRATVYCGLSIEGRHANWLVRHVVVLSIDATCEKCVEYEYKEKLRGARFSDRKNHH